VEKKQKMTSKLKKVKAAGRFGARYGRSVRAKLAGVEEKQRVKQNCPYCKKFGVKRLSKGIWSCKKCGKKFASDVYYLNN
jgi:large subunit ribosomal protein L37Ae